jgi:hypothetical protein
MRTVPLPCAPIQRLTPSDATPPKCEPSLYRARPTKAHAERCHPAEMRTIPLPCNRDPLPIERLPPLPSCAPSVLRGGKTPPFPPPLKSRQQPHRYVNCSLRTTFLPLLRWRLLQGALTGTSLLPTHPPYRTPLTLAIGCSFRQFSHVLRPASGVGNPAPLSPPAFETGRRAFGPATRHLSYRLPVQSENPARPPDLRPTGRAARVPRQLAAGWRGPRHHVALSRRTPRGLPPLLHRSSLREQEKCPKQRSAILSRTSSASSCPSRRTPRPFSRPTQRLFLPPRSLPRGGRFLTKEI